jgi:PAS domain S-box-containing protein
MELATETRRDDFSSTAMVRRSIRAKLADALSCSPVLESDLPKLRMLLRFASGVMLVFVSTCFFNARGHGPGDLIRPLRIFNVVFTLAALVAVGRISISHWRRWAMGFCLILTASFLVNGILVGDEEPLFTALFVLAIDVAVIVPWGGRWQAYFVAAGATLTIAASACGILTYELTPHWPVLASSIVFSLALAFLKDYSLRQRLLIGELKAQEAGLRLESAHRKNAEQLARKGEAILRKMLETSLDVIAISRLADLTYIYVNDRFSETGYTFEEAKGQTPAQLNIFADPQTGEGLAATIRRDGCAQNFEIDMRTKSGKVVPYLVSAVVAEIDGEECIVSMSRDITQLKHMESDLIAAREDALAASRAKSEFLSSMSHEIRTPMNAVLGMADLLTETKLTGEQRRYIDVMVANGNSLLELINSILDLARIESGRMQIEKTEFDLADLIDKTISTFGVQAHSKEIELIARIAPGVQTNLIGDPLRLRQILINFLGNAIKFTEQGEVVLEVDRVADSSELAHLRFAVSDTGIGIAPDKLKEVFSKFTQADSSTTRRYGGTGLGLAIAERLVKLMDGTIAVESELHKGSKFSFTTRFGLATRVMSPNSSDALPQRNLKTAAIASASDGHRIRILVADDSSDNRLLIGAYLRREPCVLEFAVDGEVAFEKFKSNQYDIVFMDVQMPEIDGLATTRLIRKWEKDNHRIATPIIALTASALEEDVQRTLAAGCDLHLSKPIKKRVLLETISSVMALRENAREEHEDAPLLPEASGTRISTAS